MSRLSPSDLLHRLGDGLPELAVEVPLVAPGAVAAVLHVPGHPGQERLPRLAVAPGLLLGEAEEHGEPDGGVAGVHVEVERAVVLEEEPVVGVAGDYVHSDA